MWGLPYPYYQRCHQGSHIMFILSAIFLSTIACTTPIPTELQGEWILKSIDDQPASSLSLTINGDGTFSGGLPCNSMSGTISFKEGKVQLSNIMSTTMGCTPEILKQESAYLSSIGQSTSWIRTDNQLTLTGSKQKLIYTSKK